MLRLASPRLLLAPRSALLRAPAAALSSGKEPYTERMAKTGRPVAPHVEIYAFPPAALSSITNRATGIALYAGLFGMAGASLVGVDVPAMMSCIGSSAVGPLAKIAVAFPLSYHFLGGLRHLYWDRTPSALLIKETAQSSYAIFGAAGLFSLIAAFL